MPVSPKNRPRKRPVPEQLPADDPWCGLFVEHDCTGADCPRRPTRRDIGFAGRQRHESENTSDE